MLEDVRMDIQSCGSKVPYYVLQVNYQLQEIYVGLLAIQLILGADKLDYSGFKREEWRPRNLEDHKIISKHYRDANTKLQQDDL